MDAALFTKFAPVFVLDSGEKIAPCTFESYVGGSSLLDTEHGVKIAEPGDWSLADYADNKTVCMNFDIAPQAPQANMTAPVYGVCSVAREGSKVYYSLLFIVLFPVGLSFDGDVDKMGQQWPDVAHVRIYVDKATMKIAKVFFPGYAGSGGWVQPEQAQFADGNHTHVQVFVGRGTHSLNPRSGTIWRVGGTPFNDQADGQGVVWRPTPAAMPAFLSAWTGDLGTGVPTPQQSAWFSKDLARTGDDLLSRTVNSYTATT